MDLRDHPDPQRAGLAALDEGRYHEAQLLLMEAARRTPESHLVHYALARAYFKQGDERRCGHHAGIAHRLAPEIAAYKAIVALVGKGGPGGGEGRAKVAAPPEKGHTKKLPIPEGGTPTVAGERPARRESSPSDRGASTMLLDTATAALQDAETLHIAALTPEALEALEAAQGEGDDAGTMLLGAPSSATTETAADPDATMEWEPASSEEGDATVALAPLPATEGDGAAELRALLKNVRNAARAGEVDWLVRGLPSLPTEGDPDTLAEIRYLMAEAHVDKAASLLQEIPVERMGDPALAMMIRSLLRMVLDCTGR